MGRGVENGILSQILIDAKHNGVEEIRANFIPTQKNKPAENKIILLSAFCSFSLIPGKIKLARK